MPSHYPTGEAYEVHPTLLFKRLSAVNGLMALIVFSAAIAAATIQPGFRGVLVLAAGMFTGVVTVISLWVSCWVIKTTPTALKAGYERNDCGPIVVEGGAVAIIDLGVFQQLLERSGMQRQVTVKRSDEEPTGNEGPCIATTLPLGEDGTFAVSAVIRVDYFPIPGQSGKSTTRRQTRSIELTPTSAS